MNVLVALKQHMTCAVCLDVFKTPTVITKCLHVFCEVCIKNDHLENKCPECRMPFTATELKFSHRDQSIIELYKNAKILAKKKSAVTKTLCNLVDTISAKDAEILFKIIHKEPLPMGVKLLEIKEHAVYQIKLALTGTNRFKDEDFRFLYQLVLDLSEGDRNMEQTISTYHCFKHQKNWVIPLDILQKARKIALEKKDSTLLAYSFNHPEETYASVEEAATALDFSYSTTENASFFLRILSLPHAQEELRSQAATKYFSFNWTSNFDETMLRELLFSDLSIPLLTQCIRGCASQALCRNAHVYRTLCLWLVTSPLNKSLEMLKRETIDRLVENLENTKDAYLSGLLFSDLTILEANNPTVAYLCDKYLDLLKRTQYNQTIYLPIPKTFSKYSAFEFALFHLMFNAIKDEKLPIQTAYQYIPRLLSCYQSRDFCIKLPYDCDTTQKLIDLLPQHLKEYAIRSDNHW